MGERRPKRRKKQTNERGRERTLFHGRPAERAKRTKRERSNEEVCRKSDHSTETTIKKSAFGHSIARWGLFYATNWASLGSEFRRSPLISIALFCSLSVRFFSSLMSALDAVHNWTLCGNVRDPWENCVLHIQWHRTFGYGMSLFALSVLVAAFCSLLSSLCSSSSGCIHW